uniref:Peroxisomal fatty acid beta-oxidation multifunctional protein AIM1 isoform X1 n=1 Tax=Rhizophora mucronata TaxID=61149 RepID=A0A2P2NQ05_RHIMU
MLGQIWGNLLCLLPCSLQYFTCFRQRAKLLCPVKRTEPWFSPVCNF